MSPCCGAYRASLEALRGLGKASETVAVDSLKHRSPRATLCEEVKILLIEKTSSGEEVMPMYVTLSELLAVLTLIAFVVSIVLDANNNKKN